MCGRLAVRSLALAGCGSFGERLRPERGVGWGLGCGRTTQRSKERASENLWFARSRRRIRLTVVGSEGPNSFGEDGGFFSGWPIIDRRSSELDRLSNAQTYGMSRHGVC